MIAVDRDALAVQLAGEEGLRLRPYVDTAGKITIGIGRNLTDDGISYAEAELLFTNDVQGAIDALTRQFAWFLGLDGVRQRALIDLCFNLGLAGLLLFPKMLAALEAGAFETAADELIRSEIPTRRKLALAAMLRTGPAKA